MWSCDASFLEQSLVLLALLYEGRRSWQLAISMSSLEKWNFLLQLFFSLDVAQGFPQLDIQQFLARRPLVHDLLGHELWSVWRSRLNL